MCDIKKDFLRVAQIDSQNLKHLGQDLNLPWLEQEAAHNEKNPGRAVTKAAANAALWWAGSWLGGAGEAANAAGTAADAVIPAATDAASMTAEQLAQQAAQQSLQGGLNTTMESALADTGYTPSSLFQAFKNANAANNTPLAKNLLNYGKELGVQAQNGGLLNRVTANLGDKQNQGLLRMGTSMMNPEPQQQPMPQPAPRQQASQEPLPLPYGPGGNSMGLLGLSEEQKRRLRAMGYQV